jgi:hypothetical protein
MWSHISCTGRQAGSMVEFLKKKCEWDEADEMQTHKGLRGSWKKRIEIHT